MNIGLPEILIVAVILLLIFGGRRIPEVGRALGTGFRNLREHVGRRQPGGGEIDEGEEAHPSQRTVAEPCPSDEAVEPHRPVVARVV